jgi:hypothetical protein
VRHALAVHVDAVPLDADQAAIGERAEGRAGAMVDHPQLLDPLPQRTTIAAQDGDGLGVLDPTPFARLRPLLERTVRQLAHQLFRLLVGRVDSQQVRALAVVQGRRVRCHGRSATRWACRSTTANTNGRSGFLGSLPPRPVCSTPRTFATNGSITSHSLGFITTGATQM